MAAFPNSIPAPEMPAARRAAKSKTKPHLSAFPRAAKLRGYVSVPDFVPHDVPGSYIMQTAGRCLEPIIYEGDRLLVEPIVPKAGEFACFYFKGREQGLIKRLSADVIGWPVHPDSEVVHFVEFAQLNPWRNYGTPADTIEAMHRVMWLLRGDLWLDVEKIARGHQERWDAMRTGFYMVPDWSKVPAIEPVNKPSSLPLSGTVGGPNPTRVVDLLPEAERAAYLAKQAAKAVRHG